jgi:hypothetical protein
MNYQKWQQDLLETVQLMLLGKIHLVEGCRKVCVLASKMDEIDNKIFTIFRAVESDTDHYPMNEARNRCDENYLKKIDKEIEDYISEVKNQIIDGCYEVIKFINENRHPSKTAAICDEKWLMCPECMDAWESKSSERVVICPYCNKLFLNPRYQK